MSGTQGFFHAMAPTLTANLLTVTFVYCVARITQMERNGQEGRGTYLLELVEHLAEHSLEAICRGSRMHVC